MKRIFKYISILAIVGGFTSCDKWLDITPEDTTTAKQLFKDAGGFHSAINGIYQEMSTPALYGENLTWGFASALSQYYDNASKSNDLKFSYTEKYDFESKEVKRFGEEIWKTSYNAIANANNVLQELESADKTMFPSYDKGEVDLIKGEALAIRGLLHFELLRLFADAPVVNADAKAIPYVTSYPKIFSDRLTVKQVLDNIEKDLTEASTLLASCDTVEHRVTSSGLYNVTQRYQTYNGGSGLFFTGRGVRLNFIAVQSLLARFYAYAGNYDKAYKYADFVHKKYVKDKQYYEYTVQGFSDNDKEATRPHKLIEEILLSFYHENLSTEYAKELGANGKSYVLKGMDKLFLDKNDIRFKKLTVLKNDNDRISDKFISRDNAPIKFENNILVIMRLPEINLIRAEYLANNNKLDEAIAIISDLNTARGVKTMLGKESSKKDVLEAIRDQFNKEYIAEGQYFFYCKEHNFENISNNGVFIDMNGKYTLAIPDSQTSLK